MQGNRILYRGFVCGTWGLINDEVCVLFFGTGGSFFFLFFIDTQFEIHFIFCPNNSIEFCELLLICHLREQVTQKRESCGTEIICFEQSAGKQVHRKQVIASCFFFFPHDEDLHCAGAQTVTRKHRLDANDGPIILLMPLLGFQCLYFVCALGEKKAFFSTKLSQFNSSEIIL